MRVGIGKAQVENESGDDEDGAFDGPVFDKPVVKLVLAFFCDFREKRKNQMA